MDCHHYDAHRCRSCTLLEVPRARQLTDKEAHARSLVPAPVWLPTVAGPEAGFRNKAKMAVGGTAAAPTLGILDRTRTGVDLRDCGLHSPGLTAALEVVAAFITRADLAPYDVTTRRGELKHVLLTESPDGELMLRLVVRSTADETRIRKHLPWLLEALPDPARRLAQRPALARRRPRGRARDRADPEASLPMRLEGLDLALRPQGFFQTNTHVAAALYAQARDWVAGLADVRSAWDLYCGVGGFALAVRRTGSRGHRRGGVRRGGGGGAGDGTRRASTFVAGDATAWALAQPAAPDLVVVNPPRRGIGADLARWLEAGDASYVVYSSCNAESLAARPGR